MACFIKFKGITTFKLLCLFSIYFIFPLFNLVYAEGKSCDPDMNWSPKIFNGPVFYVATDTGVQGEGSIDKPFSDLQHAMDLAPDGSIIKLLPGIHTAHPEPYTDPSCGNCEPNSTKTPRATVGFRIKDKSLKILGSGADSTILKTNSGYGLYVNNSCESELSELTITGGVRDIDPDASDGAVVVRESRLIIQNLIISNNNGLLPAPNYYPGIAGIVARERSDLVIINTKIANNSWDGVAVYNSGKIRLYNSVIKEGYGVGVGTTGSAKSIIINNNISNYWKGIGAFADSEVIAYNNTIHHNLGWGMYAGTTGKIDYSNNTVAYNDMNGVTLSQVNNGIFQNNLIAFNGLYREKRYPENSFGGRSGLRLYTQESQWQIRYNVLYGNRLSNWIRHDNNFLPENQWQSGNLSEDPKLVSEFNLIPQSESSIQDKGNPELLDPNGTRSDIGATGGPYANSNSPFPPEIPKNLTAKCNPSAINCTFSWSSDNNATYYLFRADDKANEWTGSCENKKPEDMCLNISSPVFTGNTIPYASYDWWVHSCNESGCSEPTQASFTALAGDITGDGKIDYLDFAQFKLKFNTSDSSSDLNSDSKVNLFDLNHLVRNFKR